MNDEEKLAQVRALLVQAYFVRGLQVLLVLLGLYTWLFEERDIWALVISIGCAWYLQKHLPALPTWAKERLSRK